MPYKLIALDLDGTLLDKDRKVSVANRSALDRAAAAGIRIMINSGRILPEAEACVAGVGSVSLVSGCNGAIIRDAFSGELIFMNPIGREACARAILDLSAERLLFCVYGEDTVYFPGGWVERLPAFPAFVKGRSCPFVVAEDLLGDLEARRLQPYKIFAMSDDTATIRRLRARLGERDGLALTSSSADNIELTASGIDKGNALRVVGSLLGILPEEMVAIGDGENDLPMLAFAGLSVAMGNADSMLRRGATRVTESNAQDGVAAAIDRYVLD